MSLRFPRSGSERSASAVASLPPYGSRTKIKHEVDRVTPAVLELWTRDPVGGADSAIALLRGRSGSLWGVDGAGHSLSRANRERPGACQCPRALWSGSLRLVAGDATVFLSRRCGSG